MMDSEGHCSSKRLMSQDAQYCVGGFAFACIIADLGIYSYSALHHVSLPCQQQRSASDCIRNMKSVYESVLSVSFCSIFLAIHPQSNNIFYGIEDLILLCNIW